MLTEHLAGRRRQYEETLAQSAYDVKKLTEELAKVEARLRDARTTFACCEAVLGELTVVEANWTAEQKHIAADTQEAIERAIADELESLNQRDARIEASSKDG